MWKWQDAIWSILRTWEGPMNGNLRGILTILRTTTIGTAQKDGLEMDESLYLDIFWRMSYILYTRVATTERMPPSTGFRNSKGYLKVILKCMTHAMNNPETGPPQVIRGIQTWGTEPGENWLITVILRTFGNFRHILVLVGSFTVWVEVFPYTQKESLSKMASQVVKSLLKEVIPRFSAFDEHGPQKQSPVEPQCNVIWEHLSMY